MGIAASFKSSIHARLNLMRRQTILLNVLRESDGDISQKRKAGLDHRFRPDSDRPGVEFDYSAVHGVMTLKSLGFETIMLNNNPETVSTDYEMADRLYFEPITPEHILNVAEAEDIDFAIVQFGGQSAINVAQAIEKRASPCLGHHRKPLTYLKTAINLSAA
ncbi:hypothetical protein PO124_22990 [Bacillus licheniformis]|nr:hypothetical protein [Bacillus licheniformis]